jgi:replicative DNA helicase
MAFECIYPVDSKAESFVLGAIMVSVNAADYVLAELCKEDFDSPKHQVIYQQVLEFWKERTYFDLDAFCSELKLRGALEVCGGAQYLVALSVNAHGVDHQYYAKKIKNLHGLRSTINAARKAIEQSCDASNEAVEVITQLHKDLFNIEGIKDRQTKSFTQKIAVFEKDKSFVEHFQWMLDQVANGAKPYSGIPSGYPLLDEMFGYFRPGAIYYVGARTSMGKTTFALNLIIKMIQAEIKVGIFSLEMPMEQLTSKLICFLSGISFSKYEDAQLSLTEQKKIFKTIETMPDYPLFFEDEEDITISKLRARGRRLVANYGVQVIFIDYLTRIKADTKYPSKHLQVDEISKGLQSMAKELNIPIICLAQLSRESARRTKDNRIAAPTLTDFRESGSIEEDADGCIFLHRPDYYDRLDKPGIIEVIIAKNRIRGKLGKIEFSRDASSEQWRELEKVSDIVQTIHLEKKEDYVDKQKTREAEYEDFKDKYDSRKW